MAKIQTVLGPIDTSNFGRSLTHEHFSLNFDYFYVAPPTHLDIYLNKNRIAIDNVGMVRQYPYGSRYNIHFCDEDTHKAVMDDIKAYRKFGGRSVVENTSHGLNRNLDLFCDIAKESGVHVVAGTGHYIEGVQSTATVAMTVEEMVNLYVKELTVGCETSFGLVKCGFIGEVGSVWPITGKIFLNFKFKTKVNNFKILLSLNSFVQFQFQKFLSFFKDFEKRAIQATGEVQSQLGCGVSFHPGRDAAAPFEIVRLYLEAGGKAEKCVMSHLDRKL